MQGLKGLIPKQTLTDEAFQSINRKAEEHRKSAQMCIDFFTQINRFFESFSAAVEKCINDADIEKLKAPYYCLIGFVCTKLLIENKQFTEKTKNSTRQLTKSCNLILDDFSKYLSEFQGNLRKYQEHQAIAQELCKKYSRSHKNMLSSIEAYKNSLTDVTLIYNMDEKIKRYQTCEVNYKTVTSQFQAICEKSEALTERKVKIVKNYDDFKSQFTNVVKKIGSQVIEETKNFVTYYCSANKLTITFLAEQKFNLDKQRLFPFFWDMDRSTNFQMFNQDQVALKNSKSNIPLIFEHPELIKQEFLQSYNSEMLAYLKKVEENIERRKIQNKRVNDLFVQYFKIIEKVHILGAKEITQNFEKLKKKLVESFGSRLASFIKSINSIFQLLSGTNQLLVKSINSQLVSIQGLLVQEAKLLKLFNDELKSNIEKSIGKKELRKLKEQQYTQETSVINIKNFRKEANQKAKFYKHLIQGFEEKMSINCCKISDGYTNIVREMNESMNQFYSLSCQHKQNYFGQDFEKNYRIYEADVSNLIEKNKTFFDELPLNILKDDTSKITFDGEFSKMDEFKKLKKPTTAQNSSAQKQNKQNSDGKEIKQENSSQDQKLQAPLIPNENGDSAKKQEVQRKSSNSEIQIGMRKSSFKDASILNEETKKYIQLLQSKFNFKQNEEFIKSFACALSEKIVLQGRIYITTERICFHSGFNSSNIFFGKTFIQFPKQDILKIEKRMNAIFMDNSISFTTVKGELFFTSFFSRNEAYDLICKTYSINLDEHVYQFDEHQKSQIQQNMISSNEVKEEDDITEAEVESRKEKIDSILSTFPYNQAVKTEIDKEGLTAFQIFRIFYSTNEIIMNKRKYPNFLVYMKQQINHKDVQVDPWDNAVQSFMNQSNIKSTTPLKISRKIRATVPVAGSGVPFMPKTAKSQEVQNLFFYSKNKWVLEAEVTTSGVPYTDTFKVQLRTGVTSDVAGRCHISIGFYVNFIKDTMIKSVIESKSTEETIKASKIWLDEIKKYFVAIAKTEAIPKNLMGENLTEKLKQEVQAKSLEIQKISEEKQCLMNQLKMVKKELQKYKKVGIYLGVICLILLLALMH